LTVNVPNPGFTVIEYSVELLGKTVPAEELKTAEQANVTDTSISGNAGNTSSVATWYETVVSEEAITVRIVNNNKSTANPNTITFLLI